MQVHQRRVQKYAQNPDLFREASRRATIYQRYSVTLEEYEARLAEQNGECGICCGKPAVLGLDHDHNTGKIGMFLCRQCNAGLGFFRDNPQILRLAADYLEAGRHLG